MSERIRTIHCDHFYFEGSNNHWRDAFARASDLLPFDVVAGSPQELWNVIRAHRPQHIHLGMSAKGDSVPIELLAAAKRELGCTISHFYGDARFLPYHFRTANIIDRLYMTNTNFGEWAQKRGMDHFRYLPCPTHPAIFYPLDLPKIHDVVFPGNNNDPERPPLLRELAKRFDLTIYGSGWEGTGLKVEPAGYHDEFRRIVSSSKVVLSHFSRKWRHLKQCFSNRLINSLACGAAVVQTYTPDLEKVFEHGKHALLYKTEEELFELIELALGDEALRERLGKNGHEEVYAKYTYDKSVERILNEAQAVRSERSDKKIFPAHPVFETLRRRRDGLLLASGAEPFAALPAAGRLWRDDVGILAPGAFDLELEMEAIPTETLDRLDLWRECRRLLQPQRTLALRGEAMPLDWGRELQLFAFAPAASQEKRYGFIRREMPKTELDRWFEQLRLAYQVRFGSKPVDWYSMEWCLNHPLTREIHNSALLQGTALLLWAGLGDWPFALQMESGCRLVGLEASWYALDYAAETYGHENLRFLSAAPAMLPDGLFDAVILLSPPNRFPAVKPIVQEWKRLTKKNARAFLGLYPLDAPLPPDLKSETWWKQRFGESSLESIQSAEGCISVIVRI
ncbi:MAG: glycosyltransferase [Candidatus Omnitrophota bacterium]